MIHELDISEPIWKDKSVGINISRYNPDDQVKVTISYRDRHGNLTFPGEWIVPVKKIKNYPTQKVRGNTIVHLIPIVDMADTTVKLETIPKGPNILTLKEVYLETTKSQQLAKLKLVFELDDKHFSMYDWRIVEGKGWEAFGKEKLIKMMKGGFGVDLEQVNIDDPNVVFEELKKCKGQKCGCLVRHRETLKSRHDGNGFWVAAYPEAAFFFEQDKVGTVKYTMSTLQIPLKEEDQQKYNKSKADYAKSQAAAGNSQPRQENKEEAPATSEEDDDLPF